MLSSYLHISLHIHPSSGLLPSNLQIKMLCITDPIFITKLDIFLYLKYRATKKFMIVKNVSSI